MACIPTAFPNSRPPDLTVRADERDHIEIRRAPVPGDRRERADVAFAGCRAREGRVRRLRPIRVPDRGAACPVSAGSRRLLGRRPAGATMRRADGSRGSLKFGPPFERQGSADSGARRAVAIASHSSSRGASEAGRARPAVPVARVGEIALDAVQVRVHPAPVPAAVALGGIRGPRPIRPARGATGPRARGSIRPAASLPPPLPLPPP